MPSRPAKLKAWQGNYDGDRAGLIIASSKKKAAAVVRAGPKGFDDFFREVEVDVAQYKPETLYTRPIHSDVPFVEGRCPLPSR